ncbi:MAG: VWA domain-containing protein [Paludibacteraceae bacterium]|nr:VWA domain-containing protein [Paludibacteraceae bacterium]
MRRLPIYFLIDVSESMVGEPIKQVEDGMRTIIQELRTDPYALETVFVSVVAFAGRAKSLSPLTELYKFYPPKFPIGGGTALGTALNYLMDDMERSVQKTTLEVKGDWKPIIFLFTDGTPTDDPTSAIEKWQRHYKTKCHMVCISIGDNADTNLLGKLSENVLRLNGTDEYSFKAFFKWVTASIKTSSVSVSDMGVDELKLAPLNGISLEKVDTERRSVVDENFVVLHGRCSNTRNRYLIKFAKRVGASDFLPNFSVLKYRLVGAYPIEEASFESLSDGLSNRNINTNDLMGVPTCPCCGNQYGLVVCECGNIMCSDGRTCSCPWCGMEGTLGDIQDGGMDITRGRG